MSLALVIVATLLCQWLSAQEHATGNNAVHFRAVDIYLDTKDKPLAAYQLQFWITSGEAKIVGIEGGAHPAFAEPPFYDPKAMQHERVIIAAFNTAPADKLPKSKTRVATIHLQIIGEQQPGYAIKLETAATVNGSKVKAQATFEERKGK